MQLETPVSEETSMPEASPQESCLVSRRNFLLGGACAISTAVVMVHIPGMAEATELQVNAYPRKLIATLSELQEDTPLIFSYPDELLGGDCSLFRLGVEAGGGVGKKRDIVAFSNYCTHQGGPLHGQYKKEHKVYGPCPYHLTTFDLTRHGIIASGQAYQSLPQIGLEIENDNIYAVSVMGLIFGRNTNLIS